MKYFLHWKSCHFEGLFWKFTYISTVTGNFPEKIVDMLILTSSIHFWCQVPGKISKSIQKNSEIWLFWYLHRRFPGKPEVLEQNGYDLRNQHPSISQKRMFWSLHFTKNLKIDTCVMKYFHRFMHTTFNIILLYYNKSILKLKTNEWNVKKWWKSLRGKWPKRIFNRPGG